MWPGDCFLNIRVLSLLIGLVIFAMYDVQIFSKISYCFTAYVCVSSSDSKFVPKPWTSKAMIITHPPFLKFLHKNLFKTRHLSFLAIVQVIKVLCRRGDVVHKMISWWICYSASISFSKKKVIVWFSGSALSFLAWHKYLAWIWFIVSLPCH